MINSKKTMGIIDRALGVLIHELPETSEIVDALEALDTGVNDLKRAIENSNGRPSGE